MQKQGFLPINAILTFGPSMLKMKKVLVLGAGRSASTLIQYLLDKALTENWEINVCDNDLNLALKKVNGNANGKATQFDVNDSEKREGLIQQADLVISLLPVQFHMVVALDCLKHKTHLLTASYVSQEMKALDEEAKKNGVIFLNEMGLDPGIDHMCAMRNISAIQQKGGKLTAFKSWCGALVAPESRNDWGYKFTWAPRNVILAGQGTARFRDKGNLRFIPYSRLFKEIESVVFPDGQVFEGYANRDSLSYIQVFGLEDVPTILRGTLRAKDFCAAWNALIQIGLTDDSFRIQHSASMTWNELLFSFVRRIEGKSDLQSLAQFLGEKEDSPVMNKLISSGIFEGKPTEVENGTPAEILQHLLEQKWVFKETDTDMVVQQHQFEYLWKGQNFRINSSMVVKGKDHTHTAISATVGLPAAIGAKLILQDKIQARGVLIPTLPEIFEPILEELESLGIRFEEVETQLIEGK